MKIARVEVSPEACEICQNHSGKQIWIPDGVHVDDFGDLPPYHPNCKCSFEIEETSSDYIDEGQWEEIKDDLDEIYASYTEPLIPGPLSNIGISLGKFGVDSFKAYAELAQSCSQRATHIEKEFNQYLDRNSVDSIIVYTNQTSWVPFGSLRNWTGMHEWVEVYYEYLDEEGDLVQGVRYYDPWLTLPPF